VISVALYRAPEGDERADGLHIRQRNRPRRFLLARSARRDESGNPESPTANKV